MTVTCMMPIRKEIVAATTMFEKLKPHPRPRVGKGGQVYQPQGYKVPLINHFVEELPRLETVQPYIVDLFINFKIPAKPTTAYPIAQIYGDEDNLRKTVLDSLQDAKIIPNDSLIIGGFTYKCYAPEDFFHIRIWTVNDAEIAIFEV